MNNNFTHAAANLKILLEIQFHIDFETLLLHFENVRTKLKIIMYEYMGC